MKWKKSKFRWADELPDKALNSIFQRLKVQDLLTCRRVCNRWEEYSTPFLFPKTRIIFNGFEFVRIFKLFAKAAGINTRNLRNNPDYLLAYFIQDNPYWISNWSDLMFQSTKDSDFQTILTIPGQNSLSIAFLNINNLDLSHCTLSWTSLMYLLTTLQKLKTFTDYNSILTVPTETTLSLEDSFTNWLQIQDTISILPCFKDYKFPFKKLRLLQTIDDSGTTVGFYLKQLEQACCLEEFELHMKSDARLYETDPVFIVFSEALKDFLARQINTLKRLSFVSLGKKLPVLDDFYGSLNFVNILPTEILLTHFNLHFNKLDIQDPKFLDVFVPFINELKYLKVLSIRNICMETAAPRILSLIRPSDIAQLHTDISFGLIFSDHILTEFNTDIVEAFQADPSLQEQVKAIIVTILSYSKTESLSEILPLDNTIFSNAKELYINVQKVAYFQAICLFKYFDFDKIWQSFRNLTSFVISDGEDFSDRYVFSEWNGNSDSMVSKSAGLNNHDMQLLFKTLTKLQRLCLKVRMEEVTDFGMTGRIIPEVDCQLFRFGYSFSNLKDLEECRLKGLGPNITDATALTAFNNLPKLKILGICGNTKITSKGTSFLSKKFLKSEGCTLFLPGLNNKI